MKRSLLALIITGSLLATAAVSAAAASTAGPCVAGGSYDPACDVDRDGDVDIFDIQLTAGRWNTNGVWTADGWSLTGNAGTTPGTNFLGTTDNQALQLSVNGSRALLIQPGSNGSHNIIGGHVGNGTQPGASGATIDGGGASGADRNWVYDNYGTVGGGYNNEAGSLDLDVSSAIAATVGGGSDNTASSRYATIGGGYDNTASGWHATIGGGNINNASGETSTVGGGYNNEASSSRATVGGGISNVASGPLATVAGGNSNTASGFHATVAGGGTNTASEAFATVAGGLGNVASGSYATVAGGYDNTAAGSYSFAAGRRAEANHSGAFVLADGSDFDVASTVANSLRMRFTGGMRMIVAIDGTGNYTVNCLLSQGTGSWSCSSSLAAMENVQAADSRDILERLSQLPVMTWQAGAEGVRHIGPAEEAFHAAFGLGQPGEGISTIDLDGVALASIQALYKMVQEKDAQIAALQQQNADLQARLAAIEQALGIGQ